MPWHIGIDEAGLGPNLGPLLQTAVGTRLAEPCDLWKLLTKAVQRAGGKRKRRLVIDDSKKVYGPTQNLAALELGVLAALFPPSTSWPMPVQQFLGWLAPSALAELRGEPWFRESETIPVATEVDVIRAAAERFHTVRESAALSPFWAISRVTCPATFNTVLAERDNKADVTTRGLCWLIAESCRPEFGSDDIVFAIDRQGGRIYYAAMLYHACPEGFVEVLEETEMRCRYRMQAQRQYHWTFQVEAESEHFNVALASMISKYVREVLMGQFNRFWQLHVPGLKATAGYPGDAARFYEEIRPAMKLLQIEECRVWRRK